MSGHYLYLVIVDSLVDEYDIEKASVASVQVWNQNLDTFREAVWMRRSDYRITCESDQIDGIWKPGPRFARRHLREGLPPHQILQ
ncbi:predicted protein [Botrytis cinerea T4]|uniref:Uncharacterized protein n=1 Tax=Botryotinia fuckeliana (strain T4) TaxID=999810 RepID=G2Y3I2_BOTF4|nr:predicted protein [Botrytis cinerea T4]